MKNFFKLFKPILIPIIISICFLFVQARLELKLPDYTANIVNVGIQQYGIETPVFKKISVDAMDRVLLFTDKDEYILSMYDKSKNIYTLKSINESESLKLAKYFEDPIFMYNVMNNLSNNPEMLKAMGMNVDKVNVDALYELFKTMPDEQRNSALEGFKAYSHGVSSSIKTQSNISVIVNEYKTVGLNVDKMQMNYLYKAGFKMIVISLFIMLVAIIGTFLSARIGAKFSFDLRDTLVKKIMSFSNKEYEEFSTASLITRTTNDVQQVQMLIIMLLRIVIYAPILGFGALGKVYGSSLSWIIGLAILLIIMLIILMFAFALPKFKIVQKIVDKVNLISREIISGISVIRAFSREKYEEKRFDKANKDLTNVNLFINRIMSFMMPAMTIIMNGVAILIVWVGGKKVDLGTLQVGDLMAFITYSMQIIISFLMISIVSIILPRAIVSLKRIIEVLNKDTSISNPENPKRLVKKNGLTIDFNDVSFMYHDATENVLEDITFTAKPGTTTAIIGSTGCGKSTLINLIPRFFDVTKGSISINGIDIRDLTLEDLRKNIGYVPQKGYLFTGDIASNIKFSKEKVSDKDMINAAKIAQASDFINRREHKYHELITEGGTNVSGGQKQRLAIARALAFNPGILIFDDSFSALDFKTDANLRKSIKKNVKNATVLIVAQRISTVLDADQIIVLDAGKVVGIGNHKELMEKCPIYEEIALSQLSKEEL